MDRLDMDKLKENLILEDNPLIPMYHRLASAIKKLIVNGYFREGDYIPTWKPNWRRCLRSADNSTAGHLKLCNDGLWSGNAGKERSLKAKS